MKLYNLRKVFLGSFLTISIFSCYTAIASENISTNLSKASLPEVKNLPSPNTGINTIFEFLPFSNLKLTSEQKKEILDIVSNIDGNEHFNNQADLRNKLNLVIFENNFLENKEVNNLLDALMVDYRNFLISEITLENKIYNVLNDEQKNIYVKNIKDATELLKSDSSDNDEKKTTKEVNEMNKDDVKKLILSK